MTSGSSVMRAEPDDNDYVRARLHARRERIRDAQRLDALCELRSLAALVEALNLDRRLTTAREIERHLVSQLIEELLPLVRHGKTPVARLVRWMLVRVELDELKALFRGLPADTDPASLRRIAGERPAALQTGRGARLGACPAELAAAEPLLSILDSALKQAGLPSLFLFESALSHGYYRELIARAQGASGGERGLLCSLVAQEADTYHLMLVARGRLHHGVAASELLPLHVPGTALGLRAYARMLKAPDLASLACAARGRVVDELPSLPSTGTGAFSEVALLEAGAWRRYAKLARRTFRQSDMGPGVLVGYVALRRLEVANLITVVEALRLGAPAESLRARLLARAALRRPHAA